ncbi:MAG: hypothetical protein WDN45_17085 [Caulobacteraceae bacterium]
MGALVRATFAALIGLAAASFRVGPVMADEDNAYYPTGADARNGPLWERPKFTRFSALRCSAGGVMINELALSRDDASAMMGFATYTDAAKDKGYREGAGGWSLAGDELKVSGDGFELRGRWVGAFLTATITRPKGGDPMRCRFQVTALRSFTLYQ